MKLNKNLQNFPKKKYLEYLKLLPVLGEERSREYTMLALTLIALSFFGVFAINPTLTTIAKLKKELADSQFVEVQLRQKITNLGTLQDAYSTLGNEIPVVLLAIPQKPESPTLAGKIQSIAQNTDIILTELTMNQVELTKKTTDPKSASSFTFTILAQGSKESIDSFLTELIRFDRLITIESLGITDSTQTGGLPELNLRARSYFKN